MHFKRRLTAMSLVALLFALISAPPIALAHERRTLGGGKYDVVVGWDIEPAYVGEKNAASIRIAKVGTNPAEPVTGVDKTLKVDIRQGGQTKSFDLRVVFGQPGYYVADIIPTRAGDYVLTFNGSIGEDRIEEKFDSADGKFNAVESGTGLQFPIPRGRPRPGHRRHPGCPFSCRGGAAVWPARHRHRRRRHARRAGSVANPTAFTVTCL